MMALENVTAPMPTCDTSPADTAAIRIQVVSDLHLEFLTSRALEGWHGVPPNPLADFLVLAGDIGRPDEVLRLFGRWPTPVILVLGNHEFYNTEMMATRQLIREKTEGTSIILLDNDQIGPTEFSRFPTWFKDRREKLENLRVAGATLWTNYDHPTGGGTDWRSLRMDEAARKLADHRRIAYGDGMFRPEQALAEHEATVSWLGETLAVPFNGKTLVVTHHAPHAGSVHARYGGDPLNAAFVSDLPAELLSRADVWLHGHVHDSFDYMAHGCHVVANPRGYPRNAGTAEGPQDLVFENPSFDSSLLVTI